MTGVWPILLCFLIYLLLLVSALAGVIIGTNASAMAYIANSVKSLFANLLMLPPVEATPHGGLLMLHRSGHKHSGVKLSDSSSNPERLKPCPV